MGLVAGYVVIGPVVGCLIGLAFVLETLLVVAVLPPDG